MNVATDVSSDELHRGQMCNIVPAYGLLTLLLEQRNERFL
jgi:hypothetical protein